MTVPPSLLWTREEEDELRSSILARRDIAAIAKELSRTQTAIRRRASKLKLTLKVVTVELELKAKRDDNEGTVVSNRGLLFSDRICSNPAAESHQVTGAKAAVRWRLHHSRKPAGESA